MTCIFFKCEGASRSFMCLHKQTAPEYLFLFCLEVKLLEFLPTSSEGMSWHPRRPVYSLFTAAALFYLDILHKNSIELRSMGCSSAAFWRWNMCRCFLRPASFLPFLSKWILRSFYSETFLPSSCCSGVYPRTAGLTPVRSTPMALCSDCPHPLFIFMYSLCGGKGTRVKYTALFWHCSTAKKSHAFHCCTFAISLEGHDAVRTWSRHVGAIFIYFV